MNRRFFVAAALAFAALQLLTPKVESEQSAAKLDVPPEVESILRRSCFDCHSEETHLLWFDRIAPASFLVARDVHRGRAVLNFSEPGAEKRLFEAIEMIASDVMPPAPYRALHRGTAVTAAQLETLKAFARTRAHAAPRVITPKVPPGLPTEFATWTVVQLSERWDNGTVRVILGNPAALDAVKTGQVLPWPDGSALAKVAYNDAGFVQIETMKKEGERWSWQRLLGADLKPYEHLAECMGCHAPMKDRDFVYSLPEASFSPLEWGEIDSVRVENGAFFVGDRAWKQRDDPHWFGARISSD